MVRQDLLRAQLKPWNVESLSLLVRNLMAEEHLKTEQDVISVCHRDIEAVRLVLDLKDDCIPRFDAVMLCKRDVIPTGSSGTGTQEVPGDPAVGVEFLFDLAAQ